MALERLQALALFWVPQDDPAVIPAARENLAVERKGDRPDKIAVALELLELLATVNIPQPDRLVARPTDKQGGIRRIETDAIYRIAAIFSNVSFTGTTLRLSPPESTPLPR